MAASEILGLFTTPEQYQQNQLAQFQNRNFQEVQLNPFQQAAIGARNAGYQLGQGVGSALGGQDPQLQMIAATQQLARSANLTDPASLDAVSKQLAAIGNMPLAIAYSDRAKALREEIRKGKESDATISLREAQAKKAENQQQAQTDSAQKRGIISTLEQKLATDPNYQPTQQEIANARFIVATETKQKSFIDPQTNQLIVIDGLDINLAAPNVAKLLGQIRSTQPLPVTQPAADATMPTTTETAPSATTAVTPTPSLTSQPQVRVIETPSSKIKAEERNKKIAAETEEKTRAVESFDDQIAAVQSLRGTITATRDLIGPLTTGYGSFLSSLPLTSARTLEGNTQTIKNNVALAKLREMKQQSTTGASGLGALNMKEFDAIQGIIASLDPKSANYASDLEKVDKFFERAEELMAKQSGRAKQNLGTGSGAGSGDEAKIKRFIEFNGGRPSREDAIKALKAAGLIN
jgi:hypothetical protein